MTFDEARTKLQKQCQSDPLWLTLSQIERKAMEAEYYLSQAATLMVRLSRSEKQSRDWQDLWEFEARQI